MTSVNQDVGTNPRAPFMSGDSRVLRVPVLDEDDLPFDLSGATTIRWQLFATANGSFTGSAVVSKSLGDGIAVTDAPGGLFEVTIDPADTSALAGDHYHEAEIVMVDGSIHTVLIGKFKITADAIE